MKRKVVSFCAFVVLCFLGLSLHAQERAAFVIEGELANVYFSDDTISFEPMFEFENFYLSVKGPLCINWETLFKEGETPKMDLYDPSGKPLADGVYHVDVRLRPFIDRSVLENLKEARITADCHEFEKYRDAGKLPPSKWIQYFTFSVDRGKLIIPEPEEERTQASKFDDGVVGKRDFLINDDLIVDGSACIGFDCVNGESFGFDTLRLKENNLRIKFDDTSVAASFPRNDWQLTANDSANGGASKFSIDDISGGRTPFTVEANAPSHSLYVDNGGRVGFGTSTPVVDLHVRDGDTPTLRLEQDGSSGFAPQTWDVAGNETSFFIRDASNGSTLPFRIRPGASNNSLIIDEDSNIGVGTLSPNASVHVLRSDSTAYVRVEDTQNNAGLVMFDMINNGPARMGLEDTDRASRWLMSNSTGYRLDHNGGGLEFLLRENGNLEILGTLTQGSDRNRKENINPVNPEAILEKVTELPISTWNYIADDDNAVHLGPMAQDFRATFGLGHTDKGISTLDTSGVALASIQALSRKVNEKETRIGQLDQELQDKVLKINNLEAQNRRLEEQNKNLDQRLSQLEAMMNTISRKLSADQN